MEIRFLIFCILLVAALSAIASAAALSPDVQQRTDADGVFHFNAETIVYYDAQELAPEADELKRQLHDRFGLEIACRAVDPANPPRQAVVLSLHPRQKDTQLEKEGSYTLHIASDGIELASKTTAGIYYGIQTLAQLLTSDAKGVSAGCTRILDWPDLPWRGAFLNLRFVAAGEQSIENLKRLIRGFSSLKYNVLAVEVSDNLVYECVEFPNRAAPAFNRENLTELVEFARRHHVQLVPYLQTLSHVLWLRSNAALYEQIKEADIVGTWNSQYCPSNPKATQLIHDVIEEQLAIFRPKFFHIGLDEVSDGPFATCARCSKVDHVALYRKTVVDLCNQLSSHDVRPIIYADAFSPRGGADRDKPPHGWKIIDQIPRDAIINVWDYSADLGSNFDNQLRWFTDKGFDVLGASFQRPGNVASMPAMMLKNPRSMGVMLTYWYDVESWENYQTVAPSAWAMTTLGAMRAWKTEPAALDGVSIDLVARLAGEMTQRRTPVDVINIPVDLKRSFNGRFGTSDDVLPGHVISAALGGWDSAPFKLESNALGDNAIILSGIAGDGLADGKVTIPVNRPAVALDFLQTCDTPFRYDLWNDVPEEKTKKPLIGKYVVRYSDDATESIELKYNWNIADWNSAYGGFAAPIAFQSAAEDGARIVLVRHTWNNPHPDKIVSNIAFESAQFDGMSPVLLAVNAQVKNRAPVDIDTFDRAPGGIDAKWTITSEQFNGAVTPRVVATDDPDHPGVLEIAMPPSSGDASARLMLDAQTRPPSGARQLSFWINLSDPQTLGQSGVYVGNRNFEKHAAQFRVVRGVSGWQQVVMSLDSSAAALPLDEITCVRISIWIAQGQPATKLQVDDVRWVVEPARNQRLRTRWFE